MLRALSLPLLALLSSGCIKVIAGDDQLVVDTRTLDAAVTRVENRTGLRVELVRSETASVEVRLDSNLQAVLRTEVVDDVLVIEARCTCDDLPVGMLASNDAVLRIALPAVREYVTQGSGDLEAFDLDVDVFALRINGSGDALLGGRTGALDIHVNGSGDVDAHSLEARDASVQVNGSGDVRVRASESADVTINGSGDVVVAGHPARMQHAVHGSGDVTFDD